MPGNARRSSRTSGPTGLANTAATRLLGQACGCSRVAAASSFCFPTTCGFALCNMSSTAASSDAPSVNSRHCSSLAIASRGDAHSSRSFATSPERRLVLGASLRLKDDASGASRRAAIFLRCYPDARGQRLDGHLKHLEHEPVGEHMPRPLGALFAGQVRVEGAVDGQPLRHVLASGEVDGATVAESLSLLHASRPPPGATPPLSRPLETALDAAGVLASLGIERARELGSALRAATLHALEPSLIHRDFQLDQVIVTRDGRAVLVDFDRLALGSPLADLGRMRADLQIASARSSEAASTLERFTEDFVASYAECRPGVSLDPLPFLTACALMERALLPFRTLEPAWAERSSEIIELGLAALRRGSSAGRTIPGLSRERISPRFLSAIRPPSWPRWETFYPRSGPRWPGWASDRAGRTVFGLYERDSDSFRQIDPARDTGLPALAGWLEHAELLAYRPTRRATLRASALEPLRYVKLVRPKRVTEPLRRLGEPRPHRGRCTAAGSTPPTAYRRVTRRRRLRAERGDRRPTSLAASCLEPRQQRAAVAGGREPRRPSAHPGRRPRPPAQTSPKSRPLAALRRRARSRARRRLRQHARAARERHEPSDTIPGRRRTGSWRSSTITTS